MPCDSSPLGLLAASVPSSVPATLLLVVVMNQLTDLAYRLIDPRIKTS